MAQTLAENPEALLHHLGLESDVADSDNNTISVTEEDQAAIERASIIYHSLKSVFFNK